MYILQKYYIIIQRNITSFVISLMLTSHHTLSLSFVDTMEECDPYTDRETKVQRNISVELQTSLKELFCVCVYSCCQILNSRPELIKIFLDCCKKQSRKAQLLEVSHLNQCFENFLRYFCFNCFKFYQSRLIYQKVGKRTNKSRLLIRHVPCNKNLQ